jgi:hypothetical protein
MNDEQLDPEEDERTSEEIAEDDLFTQAVIASIDDQIEALDAEFLIRKREILERAAEPEEAEEVLARLVELEEEIVDARDVHDAAAAGGDPVTAAEAAERERSAIAKQKAILEEHLPDDSAARDS